MNVEDQELIMGFVSAYGRGPNVGELMMLREAKASVALSKDETVQTYAVETITPDGGFSVQGPTAQDAEGSRDSLTPEQKEILRLQKLLLMAIEAIETAWDEGATAMKKHGRRKGVPENPYRLSEIEDDPEGDDA